MKILSPILLSFVLFPKVAASQAQNPILYEQIAFDYYVNNLKAIPYKASLWTELQDYANSKYWFPSCLGSFQVKNHDAIYPNKSRAKDIITVSNQFKIKSLGKGAFPVISVSTSFSNRTNQQMVNIIEEHRFYRKVFHIEMNEIGIVVNFCKRAWLKDRI